VITYGYEDAPFPFEYHVHDFDGNSPICLTCNLDEFGVPRWSHNGENIAIPVEDAIVIVDIGGSTIARVDLDGPPFWISWSPGNQELVFSVESDAGFLLYRLNADGSNLLNLSERIGSRPGFTFGAQWSPASNQIAHHSGEGGLHISLMNPEGGESRKLVDWDIITDVFDPGVQWPPQWSPNGEKIAFTSVSSFGDLDIFVINVDGSGLTNLTDHPGADYTPVWSPDGQMIAFVSTRDGDEEVYVMAADGSNQINISNNPGVPDINPSWRPKSSK
jgi:Tol biopolymer transport system component